MSSMKKVFLGMFSMLAIICQASVDNFSDNRLGSADPLYNDRIVASLKKLVEYDHLASKENGAAEKRNFDENLQYVSKLSQEKMLAKDRLHELVQSAMQVLRGEIVRLAPDTPLRQSLLDDVIALKKADVSNDFSLLRNSRYIDSSALQDISQKIKLLQKEQSYIELNANLLLDQGPEKFRKQFLDNETLPRLSASPERISVSPELNDGELDDAQKITSKQASSLSDDSLYNEKTIARLKEDAGYDGLSVDQRENFNDNLEYLSALSQQKLQAKHSFDSLREQIKQSLLEKIKIAIADNNQSDRLKLVNQLIKLNKSDFTDYPILQRSYKEISDLQNQQIHASIEPWLMAEQKYNTSTDIYNLNKLFSFAHVPENKIKTFGSKKASLDDMANLSIDSEPASHAVMLGKPKIMIPTLKLNQLQTRSGIGSFDDDVAAQTSRPTTRFRTSAFFDEDSLEDEPSWSLGNLTSRATSRLGNLTARLKEVASRALDTASQAARATSEKTKSLSKSLYNDIQRPRRRNRIVESHTENLESDSSDDER